MDKTLIKRNYLGDGYIHSFKNNIDGSILNVPCSKEDYIKMGGADGSKHNPKLEGYTWLCSYGGTIKVDTPNTLLGVNEYCDYKDGYFVQALNANGKLVGFTVGKEHVSKDKISQNIIDTIWQSQ